MSFVLPQPDNFAKLVSDLSKVLGPSSGIDSDDVDVEELKDLMSRYNSDAGEWGQYAMGDSSRAYTRNLVDRGNGKSNLLVLVWTPGKGSPIHDHANAHCVMKVLKGRLQETRFAWPNLDRVRGGEDSPPQVIQQTVYGENEVTYMSDQLGLHRISNPDLSSIAVSLHLYTPPNAANFGCHIFDEQTGKASHVKQCHFFSDQGRKL